MGERSRCKLDAVNVASAAGISGVAHFQCVSPVFRQTHMQERIGSDEVIVLRDDLTVGSIQSQKAIHQIDQRPADYHAVDPLGHAHGIQINRDILPGFAFERIEVDVLCLFDAPADGDWQFDGHRRITRVIGLLHVFVKYRIVGDLQVRHAGYGLLCRHPQLPHARKGIGISSHVE